MIKHILWDWNGTLLDDARLTWKSVVEILRSCGLREISFDEYRETFRMPAVTFYEYLGVDFTQVSMDELSQQFHSYYEAHLTECPLQAGIEEALNTLQASGNRQSILSAHPQGQLNEAVHKYGLRQYFDHLSGSRSNHGASKAAHGRAWFEQSGLTTDEVLLIGDTDHDAEVAQEIGIKCILVSAGHQTHARLEKTGVPVTSSISEVIPLLVKLI